LVSKANKPTKLLSIQGLQKRRLLGSGGGEGREGVCGGGGCAFIIRTRWV